MSEKIVRYDPCPECGLVDLPFKHGKPPSYLRSGCRTCHGNGFVVRVEPWRCDHCHAVQSVRPHTTDLGENLCAACFLDLMENELEHEDQLFSHHAAAPTIEFPLGAMELPR